MKNTFSKISLNDRKDIEKIIKYDNYDFSSIINNNDSSTLKDNSNDIYELLYVTSDDKIKYLSILKAQKDIKKCEVLYPKIDSSIQGRDFIINTTDYILESLDMEEVYIKVKENDQSMINNMTKIGYEDLGKEEKYIIYLREKINENKKTQGKDKI